MKRVTKGYLQYESDENIISRYEIAHFIESAGMVEFVVESMVEFMVEGAGATWYKDIPMIINSKGDILWSIKTDEDGNNIYEKFPHKVIKLMWRVEYINEE